MTKSTTDSPSETLDATDLRILDHMQSDASLSNQALAARVHVSPATCLRRVKAMVQSGLIERQLAIVQPQLLAKHVGHGLTALVEVTLDQQAVEKLNAFEARAVAHAAVQQCYRVTPGPDFLLVLHAPDMPTYQAVVASLFTQDANVRNVKAFFSIHRAKFEPKIAVI